MMKLRTVSQFVDQVPSDYMKIVLGDFNTKIHKDNFFRPTIGN